MAVDSACSYRLPSLKFVDDTLSISALISLVTLTFDLLTSNLVHVIARRVGNFPTNFGVSLTFRSRLMGQHLSDGLRDLLTLTFTFRPLNRFTGYTCERVASCQFWAS